MGGLGRYGKRIAAGGLAALAIACQSSAGIARLLLERLSRPALRGLHALTAGIPLPLAEPLALLAAAGLCAGLVRAAWGLVRRNPSPLRRWLSGALWTALILGWALVLLWVPALSLPAESPPTPGPGPLAWLCGQLIDDLNAAPLAFPGTRDSLALAPEVAGMGGCAVKAARYPEWMRAARVYGLFVPLTGEALVDADAPPALIPFTAVHELMHLEGVGDEGAANIAAWQRCAQAGGPFADSARLWVLRYALGLLREADTDAWRQARDNMKDPLAQVFQSVGGEIVPQASPSGIPRLSLSRGDYAAVAGYLCEGCSP